MPLIKSRKRGRHVLFWVVIVLVSSVLGFAVSNLSGKAYREETNAIYQAAREEESREQAQKDAAKNAEKAELEQAKNEEKQQKKEQKQKEEEEKNAQKQLKKEQKQQAKEQKNAQKQAVKEQKRREKEQKRLEKESKAALKQATQAPPTETAAQTPDTFTWTRLLQDPDRYLEVLCLIGENFNAGRVNDTLKENLSEEEILLAETVFRAGEKVPAELNETFAALCKQKGYTIENVTNKAFYKRVVKGFRIGWDSRTDELGLSFYEIPEEDYTADRRYLDAERYVDAGCILYTHENGAYKEYAEVLDVKYGAVIDDTCYGFAIKLRFLDPDLIDPAFDESQYYKDGESLFILPRKAQGKPCYFVAVTDLNRRPEPNKIDYASFFNWKPLSSYHRSLRGLDVYMGAGSCKVYQFTIENTTGTVSMTVVYPNGNREEKNYWTIVNNKSLFVLDN